MNEQQRAYLRELVFNRQHDRWAHQRGQGGFASSRVLRMLRGGGNGGDLEAFVILEHPLADEDTLLCEGTPAAAWRLNTFGLCDISVASFERLNWRQQKWPIEVIRFAADLGTDPVVYVNEFDGPDRGVLMRCEAVRTPRGLRLNITEKRKHRPISEMAVTPATASASPGVSTQTALAFLRGDDRAMPA